MRDFFTRPLLTEHIEEQKRFLKKEEETFYTDLFDDLVEENAKAIEQEHGECLEEKE